MLIGYTFRIDYAYCNRQRDEGVHGPWGNGVTMNAGGEGGPSSPGGREDEQLVPNSEDG
jgi:hypothetical protein